MICCGVAEGGDGEGKPASARSRIAAGFPAFLWMERCHGAVPRGAGVIGRIRGGGGPVLIECVPFQVQGERARTADPVAQMNELSAAARKISTAAWTEWCEETVSRRGLRQRNLLSADSGRAWTGFEPVCDLH